MEKIYDAAVIGGGPAGYYAAIRLAQLGARVILFEKEEVGGTCLNIGCIPTKSLLEMAGLMEQIKINTENGIFKNAGLYSWKKIQEQKNNIVKTLVNGVKAILKSYQIEVVNEAARLNKDKTIITEMTGKKYTANKIIIATGSKALIPKIPGVNQEKVITSTEALSLTKVPKSIAIIGGGVIGVEFASLFASFGTKVTIIEMMDSILATEDRDLIKVLTRELKDRGIDIFTGTQVNKINEKDEQKLVDCTVGQKQNISVIADFVLLAVGRIPVTDSIDIEELGLKTSGGFIVTDDRMKTNIDEIYAIGDVTGNYQLAHSAYEQAKCAAENCMGLKKTIDLTKMPRCIYSHPQLAAIGMTQQTLENKNIPFKKGIYPFAANGKALASNQKIGFVKILADPESDKILGVHILGNGSTELIASALVAINAGLTTKQLSDMIFPHPSMSEMIKEVALLIHEGAIHLPRKK